jgi:lysophospholipase L1-like esterase
MKIKKKIFFILYTLIFYIFVILSIDIIVGNKINKKYQGWNFQGFRGEIKLFKKKDYKRIAFFGGSGVMGWGLNYKEAFPYVIEKKLKNLNVDVVNLGLQGNGIAGINYDIAKYEYLDYDFAVIYNGYVDCTVKGFNSSSTRLKSFFFKYFNYLPMLPLYLEEKIQLVLGNDLNEYYAKKAKKNRNQPIICFQQKTDIKMTTSQKKKFIDHMNKFYVIKLNQAMSYLEKKNKKVIIVIQPKYFDEKQEIHHSMILKNVMRYKNVYVLNLDKIDILDKKIAYDPLHLTKHGSNLIADEIINFIEKKKLLKLN